MVYGMRGVVYANLSISSKSIDAHSGVDGGMVAEPMSDMVRLLGSISDGKAGGVSLPGFCKLCPVLLPSRNGSECIADEQTTTFGLNHPTKCPSCQK